MLVTSLVGPGDLGSGTHDHDPLGERVVLDVERNLVHAAEVEGVVGDLDRRRFVNHGFGVVGSFLERIDIDVECFGLDNDLRLDRDKRVERVVVGTRRREKSGKDEGQAQAHGEDRSGLGVRDPCRSRFVEAQRHRRAGRLHNGDLCDREDLDLQDGTGWCFVFDLVADGGTEQGGSHR